MRDVYEVLREKERAIQRLDREIKALRMAAPLLADDTDIEPATETTPGEINGPLREAHPLDNEAMNSSGKEGPDNVKSGAAKRISARLKRLATPLLNPNRVAS